jgi:hypothetical protein
MIPHTTIDYCIGEIEKVKITPEEDGLLLPLRNLHIPRMGEELRTIAEKQGSNGMEEI